MKWWNRLKQAIYNLPITRRSDPQEVRYIRVPVRHAGERVDHDTALKFSAFFCGVSYIAQTIGWLPWMVIRERGEKRTRLSNHNVTNLLHKRPNPEMSAGVFRETMVAWGLTWGNGYAEIERDAMGRPVALWPIHPSRVELKRDRETGDLYYEVQNSFQGKQELDPLDVFHLHGLGSDGLTGYSLVSLAARSLGLSMAAETVGEDFFSNGLITHGYVSHPQQLSKPAQTRLQEALKEEASGRGKRFNPLIFEEGATWGSMSIPFKDAQLLEMREFQVSEIARWLHLPLHKLGQLIKTSYRSIEAQSIETVNDAFMPWVKRLEQEADYKMFRGTEQGLYTKLNVNGLLRGDVKARGEFYQIMRNIAAYSTNDIRRLEDEDPVGPEGDALLMQMQYAPLEKIVDGTAVNSEKPQPPAQDQTQKARNSYRSLFEAAYQRILGREMGQFEQVRHRFQDNDGAFNLWWQDKFLAKHRAFMVDALKPVAESFISLVTPARNLNGDLDGILQEHISSHIDATLDILYDQMWGEKREINSTNRAKTEASSLIDSILAAVALQGVMQ